MTGTVEERAGGHGRTERQAMDDRKSQQTGRVRERESRNSTEGEQQEEQKNRGLYEGKPQQERPGKARTKPEETAQRDN